MKDFMPKDNNIITLLSAIDYNSIVSDACTIIKIKNTSCT